MEVLLTGRTDNPRGARSGLDRGERRREAVAEAHLGMPAELPRGPAAVERAPRELAQAGRLVLGRDGGTGRVLAGREQVEDARLRAGADVEGLLRARVVECRQVGPDDVADVEVVARLEAVAEDARSLALR